MDIEKLRVELHHAVDETIDRHIGGAAGPARTTPGPESHGLTVDGGHENGPFDHRWPKDVMEHFSASQLYGLSDRGQALQVVVGWTVRYAWGQDRKRVVVFGRSPTGARYPWAEFVETDDGRYSAALPGDPASSRAQLKDGDPIPARFQAAALERTDTLFRSVRSGPALRLVVAPDDVVAMIRFGYWLAGERRKR